MPLENRFRIISGEWRGRRIHFPPLPGVRPTPDRVRVTVFDWLQPRIDGARCLDLFAGSGALGLEALSRSAAKVVLVEKESALAEYLSRQLELLGTERGSVVNDEALHYLSGRSETFDVVFLDPPFDSELLPRLCTLLEDNNWLAEQAHIYIECPAAAGKPSVPDQWTISRSKRAGQVGYHLAVRGM